MCGSPKCNHAKAPAVVRARSQVLASAAENTDFGARYEAMGYRHSVFADAVTTAAPLEMFKIEERGRRVVMAGTDLTSDVRASLVESTSWLPFFSEVYNISEKLEDYVVMPVIIMPSDLPNRNCIAFPYEELVRANPEMGQLAYQTWRAKPTFIDHNNKDHTKAKGIIFSSMLRPMRGAEGDLWKVVCLAGYDRTRDPELVSSILAGERNAYSMGAWTTHFTCSVCGAAHNGPDAPGCNHVRVGMSQFTMHNGQLGYLDARNPVGFELSSVTVPAYASATTDPGENLRMWA